MGNFSKKLAVGFLSLSLCGVVLPLSSVNTVYAKELIVDNKNNDIEKFVENYKFSYISKKLSFEEKARFKIVLKNVLKNYGSLSKEQMNETALLSEKLIAKELGIEIYESRFFDGKGLEVDVVGGAIDAFIIFIAGFTGYGGAAKALIYVIKQKGAYTVKQMILEKLTMLGFGKYAPQVASAIMGFTHLTSPGKAACRAFDSIDFYPNNGRLNFWP